MSSYGPVVTARKVRNQTLQLLRDWFVDALLEVFDQEEYEQADLSPSTLVRSWAVLAEPRDAREDQMPAVFVTSPGLSDQPERNGDGQHTATWSVVVTIVVRGDTFQETADLVAVYAAAARLVLGQHKSLGGLSIGTYWRAEDYSALDISATRTLGAGQVEFDVVIPNVMNDRGGPPGEVPEFPAVDIEKINVAIDNRQVDEELV